MLCKGESEMPDSEELEKRKNGIHERNDSEAAAGPETDCEAVVSLYARQPHLEESRRFRLRKAVCGSVFSGKWDAGDILSRVFQGRSDSVSPSDGADADMTAQPEQMEQEIDEAVSEALSSYQFSADNFNSMTSVLRGIGEQGDKSIGRSARQTGYGYIWKPGGKYG